MPSDLTGGDAVHEVVTAVLAVTPIDPDDGMVIVKFTSCHVDPFSLPEWGDPAPPAARQAAAAVKRSTEIVARRTASWPRDQRQVADLVLGMFFGLADEIDPKEPRDDHR